MSTQETNQALLLLLLTVMFVDLHGPTIRVRPVDAAVDDDDGQSFHYFGILWKLGQKHGE